MSILNNAMTLCAARPSYQMMTPIHKMRRDILTRCEGMDSKILLLVAPTGSGKTTGMRSLVQERPDVFGTTWMVQPTRMASNSLEGTRIKLMTPIQLLESFLRIGRFACRTLILDEVHTRTVEYETLLVLLARPHEQKLRIVLMTATPDVEYLQSLFGQDRIDTMTIPVDSPYPVEIQYQNKYLFFPSYRQMAPEIRSCLQKQLADRPHSRILVFCYTHEQCDKLAAEFKSFAREHRMATRALFGGATEEEFHDWSHFLATTERFLVFATNVAETSITIPNVSLIIDFGIQCVQQHHRIVHQHCAQSNMIQRAGRTGRTCPGVVVRMMPKEAFERRPFQFAPEYQWDLIALRMMHHRREDLLPLDRVNLPKIRARFHHFGLLHPATNNLEYARSRFVVECPLSLENSCGLHSFLQHPRSISHLILHLMALGLIDCVQSRALNIYYFNRDLKLDRPRFLLFLARTFIHNRRDDLELIINMYLSCILSEDPLRFSKEFSLNFRSVRQISAHINKTMNFATEYLGQPRLEWRQFLRDMHLIEIVYKHPFSQTQAQATHRITQEAMDIIRHQFMMQSTTPFALSVNGLRLRENLFVDQRACLILPVSIEPILPANTPNRGLLLFPAGGLANEDLPVDWIDHQDLEEDIELVLSLYTQVPSAIQTHIRNITTSIQHGYTNYINRQNEILYNKSIFNDCLLDIREDVAHRPLQHGAQQKLAAIHDALHHLLSLPPP